MTREEAIKKLQKQKAEYLEEWVDYSGVAEAFDMAIEALRTEVVRCKECRHSRIEGDTTMYMWCGYWNKPTDLTRYCSGGKRREE